MQTLVAHNLPASKLKVGDTILGYAIRYIAESVSSEYFEFFFHNRRSIGGVGRRETVADIEDLMSIEDERGL